MKKLLTIFILALFVISLNSCGGGGSFSGGKTTVTINLGQTRTASAGGVLSTSSIPSSVLTIRFTISAPDMATIERVVSVAGRTTITETFEVPNGANRYFLVEAMDSGGNVLYRGDTYANLDGTPVTITIVMVAIPPAFDFSGMWSVYTTPEGWAERYSACLTFTQTGNSFTISGTCPLGFPIEGSGTIIGNQVDIQFTVYTDCPGGPTVVVGSGTTDDGNTMSGTYTATLPCGGETGEPPIGTVRAVKGPCTPPVLDFIDLFPSNVDNDGVDITFNVNNSGTLPANNVRVVVLYSDGYLDNCWEFWVTVPAGGSVPLTAGLTYAVNYYIWIDPNNTIPESNEANNVACFDAAYCASPPDIGATCG